MQLLPQLRALERDDSEEGDTEDCGDDLLLLLLRLEAVDPLVRHYGAPVADALLEAVVVVALVVVVVVVALVVVVAGGVAAGAAAGAEE